MVREIAAQTSAFAGKVRQLILTTYDAMVRRFPSRAISEPVSYEQKLWALVNDDNGIYQAEKHLVRELLRIIGQNPDQPDAVEKDGAFFELFQHSNKRPLEERLGRRAYQAFALMLDAAEYGW